MQKGQWIYKITKTIREIRGCICRRRLGYMGVKRRYSGVEGICRRARGYMEVQRRYKEVEGICRRHREIWEYKDDTRE